MKMFLLLLLAAVFSANAAPSSKFEEEQGPLETSYLQPQERNGLVGQKFDHELPMPVEDSEHGDRFRRVTCDLLSVNTPFGSVNHAACAAHCLALRKGYKGGSCKDGVCHCRK